jgi:hypothetical protein
MHESPSAFEEIEEVIGQGRGVAFMVLCVATRERLMIKFHVRPTKALHFPSVKTREHHDE